ncbi:hypothetical protein [Streptomyces sp. NPDC102437]|uniref:hypothetical protein n=1 Tax=Streptomyces sp. NPDC102437 TaxID=3366175 RepID=UPI0037FBE60D
MSGYATYTFLIQVRNASGEWGNLLDPHSGAPMQGTLGTVATTEEGFADAARRILERFSGIRLKRRVAFFEGNRLDEKLLVEEVFRIVIDDEIA